MAKSRVTRMIGVPEFKTTAECERYVREQNSRALGCREQADAAKARARNAAKQMVALLATQTMGDLETESRPETPEPTR